MSETTQVLATFADKIASLRAPSSSGRRHADTVSAIQNGMMVFDKSYRVHYMLHYALYLVVVAR